MNTETIQDWSACEIAEEPAFRPEADAEALIGAEPTAREKALELYRGRVDALIPTDDLTVKSCGEFVEQCKLAAKRVEERRVAQTAPLNKQLDDINRIYMPVRDAFKAMATMVAIRVNKFIDDRRRAAELETQQAVANAAAKQAELDRKAKEAKAQAAEAAAHGDTVKAAVLEGKADLLEQKAAEVVPMSATLPSNKVELGTSTVSFGGAKKIWALVGWNDRKKPLRIVDPVTPNPAMVKLVGDLSKLPEGVQFLLRHADLNPVYLNKSFGAVPFPEPFTTTNDYSKSTVR